MKRTDAELEERGTATMTCAKCGGDAFRFRWSWESRDELIALTLCHPGFGLELDGATMTCVKCGTDDPETEMPIE